MDSPPAKPRVNDIALARFERWALPRMARRLPGWVTPDMLSVVGLIAAVVIAASYLLTHVSLYWLWVASAGFLLHWWADSLDGTLARVRNIQRERYGFFVDHQCDAISALLIFIGLGLSPLMPLVVALLLLAGYYLMMILVNLVTITRDVFKISFGALGPTEARLAMIAINTLVVALGNPLFHLGPIEITLFGAIGGLGALGLFATYAVSSLIERAKLARIDPPPAKSPQRTPASPNGQRSKSARRRRAARSATRSR